MSDAAIIAIPCLIFVLALVTAGWSLLRSFRLLREAEEARKKRWAENHLAYLHARFKPYPWEKRGR